MLKNFVLSTIRAYKKNFTYTLINFIGLSLALTVCLFTYLYVDDEYSYDDFHHEPERILLLERIQYKADVSPKSSVFDVRRPTGLVKDYFHEDWSTIEAKVKNDPYIDETVTVKSYFIPIQDDSGEPKYRVIKGVSPNFFKHFRFEFLHGIPNEALINNNGLVITKDFALEHFGKTDVIGDSITLSDKKHSTGIVNVVIANPKHTIFSFDIITVEGMFSAKDLVSDPVVFIRPVGELSKIDLAERIRNTYITSLSINLEKEREELRLSMFNPVVDFRLIPVNEIYIDPSVTYGKSSHPIVSIILIAISFVLLLVACVNYLSINIASSSKRSTEIALRKAIGAKPEQLKIQFYTEAFLVTMASVVGAFIITLLLMPNFRALAQKDIYLSFQDHLSLFIYGVTFGFVLTLLAGSYPAQYLSKLNLIHGLKGKTTLRSRVSMIKVMTIVQFTLCLGFLNMAFVMKSQMTYIFNKDLGYRTQGMVLMRFIGPEKGSLMKDKLLAHPTVSSTAQFTGFFGMYIRDSTVDNSLNHDLTTIHMDQGLLKTLEIPFVSKPEHPVPRKLSTEKIYVNEFYYNLLKQDTSSYHKLSADIGGVIEDFHYESLNRSIGPVVAKVENKERLWSLLVKFDSEKRQEQLKIIRDTYAELSDEALPKIEFLNDFMRNKQSYKDTQRWIKVLNTASTLGMIITSIGLFGLVGITTSNKQKEISIRKVLGARLSNILYIVNKPFLAILLFGLAASTPLSYLIMAKWLENFAYHITLTPVLFWKSLVIVLIMIIVIGYLYAFKSQNENPAEVLKNE